MSNDCSVQNIRKSNVGIFKPQGYISEEKLAVDQVLECTVRNTGNIFYWEAPALQISHEKLIDDWDFDEHNLDTLVLSLGNWISPSADMSEICAAIESSKICNLVMIGAGVQAQNDFDFVNIPLGTQRFMKVVSERSKTIGVRGEFTASVLEKLGIKNIDVIGCPSVYMAAGAFSKRTDKLIEKRLSINTTWHGHYRDAIAELLRFGRLCNATLIEQTASSVMEVVQTGRVEKDLGFISRYYAVDYIESWDNLAYLKSHAKFFTDAHLWREALQSHDLVVGSRFHGIVAGLQSGVRSLLLTIDARTRELANFFNIPSLAFERFSSSRSFDFYHDAADPTTFQKTLNLRLLDYKAFLNRNSLTLDTAFEAQIADIANIEPEFCKPVSQRSGYNREITRYLQDVDATQMAAGASCVELLRRLEPSRTDAVGNEIECAEFILSHDERVGIVHKTIRQPWRSRQGVSCDYRHQMNAIAYDDTCSADEWQRQIYMNARRIFDSNNLERVTDFGCGSGFKLRKYFEDVPFSGIEIDDTLLFLRKNYPEFQWIDGSVIHPSLFQNDLVICSDVIEHLYEPDYLLAALAASSSKIFVLSTPALEILSERNLSPKSGPPTNPSHVFEWTTSEFHALVSKHLHVCIHSISNLSQATQMCVAIKKDASIDFVIPDLVGA